MAEVTPKDVHGMLRQYLRSRSDLGLWKAVAAQVLEPKNPFEPESIRKPQQWFVLFSIVSLAAIGAFLYFNFWN